MKKLFAALCAVCAVCGLALAETQIEFSEAGVRVPEDISIAGFDNIIINDYMPIQLTSISSPIEHLCELSVKLLLDNIKSGPEHVVQNVALQPRLVERSSTCAPKNP